MVVLGAPMSSPSSQSLRLHDSSSQSRDPPPFSMPQRPTSPSASTLCLGAPMSSTLTLVNNPLPRARHGDELHPLPSHSYSSDVDNTRHAKHLADQEKAQVIHDSATLPSGIPYPRIYGNVGVTPAVLIVPPSADEGADPEKAAAVAEAAHEPDVLHLPSLNLTL